MFAVFTHFFMNPAPFLAPGSLDWQRTASRSLQLSLLLASPCLASAQDTLLQPVKMKEQMSTNSAARTALVDELRWLKAEKISVTSVSKRAEDPFTAAAAVTVITSEEIRRSGARTLPDAMRLVPGLSVANIDGNKTAVAARGFSNVYSPMLLVLVDGRSIYQANNSGVNWILEDYLLDDIERIEVVRGPGGTLWGANAVNGVINIITKSAKDTVGGELSAGFGNQHNGFTHGRFGAALADHTWLRGYVKHHDSSSLSSVSTDYQRMTQGGFRLDHENDLWKLTLSGDGMGKSYGDQNLIPTFGTIIGPGTPKTPDAYHAERANLRAQATRTWSEDTEFQVQAYYDHSRDVARTIGSIQVQDVFDLDSQMRFAVGERQTVLVGAGYRYLPSSLNNHALWSWSQTDREQQLVSAFIHDDIELVPERLRLVLGTKVEHHDFTGWEYAPNARLSWTPTENQTIWGAVSRAVQVPGRNYNDVFEPIVPYNQLFLPPPAFLPLYVQFSGSSALKSQELISYELGYRLRPMEAVTTDLSLFYNRYHNLIAGQANFAGIVPGPVAGTFILPSVASNAGSGTTYGFEGTVDWRATDWWRLVGSYSLLVTDILDASNKQDPLLLKDPKHQVGLRSQMNLPANVDFDAMGRFVDSVKGSFGSAGSYFSLDLRLAWRPQKNLEVAVVGQNLLEGRHFEYVEDTGARSQVSAQPRGGYVQLTYNF